MNRLLIYILFETKKVLKKVKFIVQILKHSFTYGLQELLGRAARGPRAVVVQSWFKQTVLLVLAQYLHMQYLSYANCFQACISLHL
jgi:hypothetical protein